MTPTSILQKSPYYLGNSCLFGRFWSIFDIWDSQYQNLGNIWSLLFQKGIQVGILNFFHFWFFVAFNSRDMTMLWVLNLFSRSSSTKLWKRIFKKMSQNFFLILKVGKWWDCLILTPFQRSNLGQKFRWKLFFEKRFYVHWMNAHMFCIIQRLWKTSKNVFQLVIST